MINPLSSPPLRVVGHRPVAKLSRRETALDQPCTIVTVQTRVPIAGEVPEMMQILGWLLTLMAQPVQWFHVAITGLGASLYRHPYRLAASRRREWAPSSAPAKRVQKPTERAGSERRNCDSWHNPRQNTPVFANDVIAAHALVMGNSPAPWPAASLRCLAMRIESAGIFGRGLATRLTHLNTPQLQIKPNYPFPASSVLLMSRECVSISIQFWPLSGAMAYTPHPRKRLLKEIR